MICTLAFAGCSKKVDKMPPAEVSMKKGMTYFQKGKYEKAIPHFENTLMEAETPEMAAKAQLFLADAYFLDKQYPEAIPAYEQFLEIYGETDDANTALLRMGLSHYAMLSSIDRDMGAAEGALVTFVKLRDRSPGFAREYELNKKIVELRGMLAARELYVAKFYFRINKPSPAETRLQFLIDNYEDTVAYEEALYLYGKYLAGQKDRELAAVNVFKKLVKERPNSKYGVEVARELTVLLAKITVKIEDKKEKN